MKSKQKQKKRSENEFWNAIQDIRKMTANFNNDKEKKLFNESTNNKKAKGQKMPINMLKGIRKKVLDDYKKDQQRSQVENVQYRSNQKFNDKKFLDKKIKKTKKSDFQKQKYKYTELKTKQFGRYKPGTLKLSKMDIKNIKGQ